MGLYFYKREGYDRMKRKRRIYFKKTELNKEYYTGNNWFESGYTYSAIEDAGIYQIIYQILEEKQLPLSTLSKVYFKNDLFHKNYIELKCNKDIFYSFCRNFIKLLDKYIEDIEF